MTWKHCAEIVVAVLLILSAITAFVIAAMAIVKAYRAAAPLRKPSPPLKLVDRSAATQEYRDNVEQFWEGVRAKYKTYFDELNDSVNPLRKDTYEILKESAAWARLGIQYALIGNGGALAALPYLMSLQANSMLTITDATWSAFWFIGGMFSAAIVCLIVYIDFQVNASINWSEIDLTYRLTAQRYFDTEVEPGEFDMRQQIRGQLKATGVRTSLAGVWFAVLAWFCLAWGALRLILSLGP